MDKAFTLHPAQLRVWQSPARYKVVVAGRRFGKTYYSVVSSLINISMMTNKHGKDLSLKPIYYIAPTYGQAKNDTWNLWKKLGEGLIERAYEKDLILRAYNGREIHLFGADRPDTIRGQGLGDVVLDEYKDMKPEVWDEVVAPMLSDVRGGALFIGTPKGKNHFFELCAKYRNTPDWEIFTFLSKDNPYIDKSEIAAARDRMSEEAFKQEFEANFSAGGGTIFKDHYFQQEDQDLHDSDTYIAVDPAGYGDGSSTSSLKRLDETAIAVVQVSPQGWHVKDIIHGRWGVRETSIRIMNAYRTHRPIKLGIEKGALMNALLPYLGDQMRRLGIFFTPHALTHGGQKKTSRITWALQGRMEHGRITFQPGEYLRVLKDQAMDFPNSMTHDDLLDSLAYVDQLAVTNYRDNYITDSFDPVDEDLGI